MQLPSPNPTRPSLQLLRRIQLAQVYSSFNASNLPKLMAPSPNPVLAPYTRNNSQLLEHAARSLLPGSPVVHSPLPEPCSSLPNLVASSLLARSPLPEPCSKVPPHSLQLAQGPSSLDVAHFLPETKVGSHRTSFPKIACTRSEQVTAAQRPKFFTGMVVSSPIAANEVLHWRKAHHCGGRRRISALVELTSMHN